MDTKGKVLDKDLDDLKTRLFELFNIYSETHSKKSDLAFEEELGQIWAEVMYAFTKVKYDPENMTAKQC